MSDTFQVNSSSGTYIALVETGRVISADSEEKHMRQPAIFNIAEFIAFYGELDDEIDILDIGYTDHDGVYEPPDTSFRKHASNVEKQRDLWNKNKIQFARLIAEANMAGLFNTPEADAMLDSMDITRTQLRELVKRASKKFNKYKKVYTNG